MTDAKYIIGIDLGTTNCTLTYLSLEEETHPLHQLAIPQLVGPGTIDEQLMLPSFAYLPLKEELKAKVAHLDWDSKRKFCVGVYARDRGAEVSDRLIASAKSWLCHAGINRREKNLPLACEDEEEKMSPVDTCAALLQHLREAWAHKMKEIPFEEQQLLVTVPASFDPSARQLVLEAAERAGFPVPVLLEEPQAAFYAWLKGQGEEWRKHLNVGDVVLVVDIGGGTTDFSLIAVEENEGDLALNRIAVGAHLLLGGDNIDLALAYLAKEKLENEGNEIDEWQLDALKYQCRQAKESLLGQEALEKIDLTIIGRGSSLMGNTLTTTLTKKEVQTVVLDGFFPLTPATERALFEQQGGITQVGLPYVRDARITSQLATFLATATESFVMPTAVLFNGGTMKSAAIQERVVAALNGWAESLEKPSVKVLPGHDYDYAVSKGAAYYGLARQGKAIRIKGGASHSYFIGIEDAMPAVPGREPPLTALCIVPHGMEEGTEQRLTEKEFSLVVGAPARFRFFSHNAPTLSNGTSLTMGTSVRRWKGELIELPFIETQLDKKEDDGKTIPVTLKSCLTEMGMLELWCEGSDGRQWKLEFNARQ